MSKSNKSPSPSIFWNWFEENRENLTTTFCDIAKLSASEASATRYEEINATMNGLMEALHEYDKRLFPYAGLNKEAVIELIFTAEGNVEAFPAAHALKAEAPEIDGWRFIALKPRADKDQMVEIRTPNGDMASDMVQYALIEVTEGTGLIMVIKSNEKEPSEEEAFMCANLAETILGEEDFASKIDAFQVITFRQFFELNNGLELKKLPTLLDSFDSRFAN